MLSKKLSRQDIPKSNENNLYFVDRSLAQFAKTYDPTKSATTTCDRNVEAKATVRTYSPSSKDQASSK